LHYGFQKVYAAALRTHARKALKDAFEELGEVDTLILTGHSLGGTLSQFMLLEILEDILCTPDADSAGASKEEEWPWRQNSPNIVCATFGSPRPGNKSFKKYYANRIAEYREKTGKDLKHWSVVGHRDGVPATPPGFAPVTSVGETFYLYHGDLYNVPVDEAKHSIFKVVRDESRPARFEHGGHNYYSARDMERLIHRLRHIREDRDAGLAVEEWTKRYLQREEEFRLAQVKKTMKLWRRSKSTDLTHQVTPSTSFSPGHTPTSSEIIKEIEKKDETTDGQTAVEPSRIDWSKTSLEDDLLVETDAVHAKETPTVSVDESDSTTKSTTNAQTTVPVFATATVAGESAKDLAAATPLSQ
jgi:DNA-binding transcriptional MerR regulator